MKYNKTYKIFFYTCLILLGLSCEDPEGEFYDYELEEETFDGSILEYLQVDNGSYDSLLVVIDRVPGLRERLEQDNITLFAIQNAGFQTAILQLNQVRENKGKEPIYLQDLNAADLDTLVSRYVFDEEYALEEVQVNTNGIEPSSINYNYTMHLEYEQADASGIVQDGSQRLIFSDPNNSELRSNWSRTSTLNTGIHTGNGIVYPLNPGHTFGFDDFVFRFNKFNVNDDEL